MASDSDQRSPVIAQTFADRSMLLHALDTLAEGDRALITLRFRNGLEYDELATAFGLKEGTVRMRVSRALARMREVIGAEAEGVPVAGFAAAAPSPSAPTSRARRARAEAAAPRTRGALPPIAAATAAPASSWWSRFKRWALGAGDRVQRPEFVPNLPLGVALAACMPVAGSDALNCRLGALVDTLASPART